MHKTWQLIWGSEQRQNLGDKIIPPSDLDRETTSQESLEDNDNEDLDWEKLRTTPSPKEKKAKKKLKKILDAKNFTREVIKDAIQDKRDRIQANKRNFNAQRINRANIVQNNTHTLSELNALGLDFCFLNFLNFRCKGD